MDAKEEKNTAETQAQSSPEQRELQTMTTVSDIVLNQFLENIILNINLTPVDKKFDVDLYLQANEFISEETLLKNSYSILKPVQQIKAIHDFTIKWHMLVKNRNTEVLTLSFNEKTISSIENFSYADLKQSATTYRKHENLH